jgi:hypothetical protein
VLLSNWLQATPPLFSAPRECSWANEARKNGQPPAWAMALCVDSLKGRDNVTVPGALEVQAVWRSVFSSGLLLSRRDYHDIDLRTSCCSSCKLHVVTQSEHFV